MAQPSNIPAIYGDIENVNYAVVPNAGQVVNDLGEPQPNIAYYTKGGRAQTFFQKDALFSIVLAARDTIAALDTLRRLDVSCVGVNANYPEPTASVPRDDVTHFYLPQCGPEGATNVAAYGQVLYADIYPFIDMLVYGGLNGQKLAYVVRPGGDPKDIQLLFEGQNGIVVDTSGNLQLDLAGAPITLPEAVSFQIDSADAMLPLAWTAVYQVDALEGKVTFNVGSYDPSKALVLVIGPPPAQPACCTEETEGICWSTFYGGKVYDFPKDIQSDYAGNVYVAGRTESLFNDFPHFTGASTTALGVSVATLTKFDAAHVLIWTIFHGGNMNAGSNSSAAGITIKENPTRVYMAGTTNASDFFTWTQAGAYNALNANANMDKSFLAMYDEFGTIQWSTYIGLNNIRVQSIDVDPYVNHLAISGIIGDSPLANYPPPFAGYQFNTYHGSGDAFIIVFNLNDNVDWSAYYGGADQETRALVRCLNQGIVLAGDTRSAGLPVSGPSGSFVEPYHALTDIFIVEFDLQGTLKWATYFGGAGNDRIAPQGISYARDLYITGTCNGLPTLVNGPGWYDDVPAAQGRNGFIARFQNGNHAPKWITYLGEGPVNGHEPYCLSAGSTLGFPLTVGGYTDDTSFPSQMGNGYYYQPSIVPDDGGGVKDGFLIQFDDLQNLEWSSYFGGRGTSLTVPENVTAVLNYGSSIYAVGYTSQDSGYITPHIPLDGNSLTMFFNPNYNFDASGANFTDGFITQFCNEDPTAKSFPAGSDDLVGHIGLRLTWITSSELLLLDLADGPHQLRVYDAQGRFVLSQQVQSEAGRSESIPFREKGSALYFLVVDNQRTGRLVPIH